MKNQKHKSRSRAGEIGLTGKSMPGVVLAGMIAGMFPAASLADNTLGTVYVYSDKDDFEARQASTTTRLVYGREELERMNELTVGDYLRRLPSVTFTGPPGNPKDVCVRGMDKGYTEILIDGEPVATGTKERQIQVDRLPLDMVERIEIIRAPTSDLSNEGLMGTINIVLRDAPQQRVANARLVAGQINGEKTDKNTWNLSGQYGNATGDVRWLLNAAVGQRGDLKTKSKSEEGFVAATSVRNSWKDEFEDERVTTDTLDFSPRLNVKLSAVDELVFTPWITRSDERKTKAVDKFRYNTPATGANYVGDGRRSETEGKLRETARLRGAWKRQLDGGQFSLYAAAQMGGEETDKDVQDFNAAGALTKVTVEKDDKDEREWYLGGKWSQKFGAHKLGAGLEYKDKSRKDVKTKREGASYATLTPKPGGRGDNFDIAEKRWTAFLQDEITLGGGHFLTPGVRALRNEQASVDGLGQRRGGTVNTVTPSLHYLWRANAANNLRASVTRTVKPPQVRRPVHRDRNGQQREQPDQPGQVRQPGFAAREGDRLRAGLGTLPAEKRRRAGCQPVPPRHRGNGPKANRAGRRALGRAPAERRRCQGLGLGAGRAPAHGPHRPAGADAALQLHAAVFGNPRFPTHGNRGLAGNSLIEAYIGLPCTGKCGFDAIESLRWDAFFRDARGLASVPSSPTRRARRSARHPPAARRAGMHDVPVRPCHPGDVRRTNCPENTQPPAPTWLGALQPGLDTHAADTRHRVCANASKPVSASQPSTESKGVLVCSHFPALVSAHPCYSQS